MGLPLDPEIAAWVSAGVLLVTGACSAPAEDDSAAAESFRAGLPADTELDELSDEEYRQLCEAANEYFANNAGQQAACLAGALGAAHAMAQTGEPTEAELRQACAETRAQCLEASHQPQVLIRDCAPLEVACAATVSEVTDCVNALAGQRASLPDCEELTLGQIEVLGSVAPGAQPQPCVAAAQDCPELIQGAASTGGGAGGAAGATQGGAGSGGAAGGG
jgi:hypothetical protein